MAIGFIEGYRDSARLAESKSGNGIEYWVKQFSPG